MVKKFKYCSKCGNKLDESVQFCHSCGEKILTDDTNHRNDKQHITDNIDDRKKRKNSFFLILGLLLIIIPMLILPDYFGFFMIKMITTVIGLVLVIIGIYGLYVK